MQPDTLIIVGNGFDLAHRLPTAYTDYKRFLENDKSYKGLISQLENFFGEIKKDNKWILRSKVGTNILWTDLEHALGVYNIQETIHYLCDGHDFSVEHPCSSEDEFYDELECLFIPTKEQFQSTFSQWIKSVSVNSSIAYNIPYFNPNALFLSFNYTDTLETIYHIPEDRILHIHGYAKQPQNTLIVGHNTLASEKMVSHLNDGFIKYSYISKKIIETINGLYKDTTYYIRKNERFFNRLFDVQKIVVYGHSMSDIDIPYFEHIMENVQRESEWYVSLYNPDDECNCKKAFLNKLDCVTRFKLR